MFLILVQDVLLWKVYLPTGTLGGQHTKSWQFLAVPTNGGQTINAAWQEGAAVANADPRSRDMAHRSPAILHHCNPCLMH
ncbi:MAG: hypothetical protein V9E88_05160 [Ferruginibacter sp.]